ncbi:MAG: nicotinate-nucleotide--dimethylbenzimidazole phosphoribosyltransferase [Pseudomonadota bacterium]
MNSEWYLAPCANPDQAAAELAQQHQSVLTKPPGSLGVLEEIAIRFAAWQGVAQPQCENILLRVFAGDHGVCKHGVSAFPQQVTAQMIHNFIHGGAAISVLARRVKADFAVVNAGTVEPIDDAPSLHNAQLANGTADFTEQAAMTPEVLAAALDLGRQQVSSADLFVGGEMGIGNTTAASAIYCALLDISPESAVGPGTGVDDDGLERKNQAIYRALAFHANKLNNATDVLQRIGGLEIASLVGAYIASAQAGVPVLVDGFISTAAALVADEINPGVREWLLFAHESAEPAHTEALKHLHAQPLLNLGMRLGEGSGAGVAVPLIQTALALHAEMATFVDAGVSEKAS